MTIEDKIAAWPPKPRVSTQCKNYPLWHSQVMNRAIAERNLALEVLRLSHDALAAFATDESPAGWNAIHAITQINAVLAACGEGDGA